MTHSESSGPSRDPVLSAATLPALLHARADATPHAEALRFGARSLTCAQVVQQVDVLARMLRTRGVGAGDRVALLLPNGLEFPLAWLAAPCVRAIAVPVNVGYRSHDLARVLSHSGASVVVCGAGQRPAVDAVRDTAPNVHGILQLDEGWSDARGSMTAASDGPTEWIDAPSAEPVTIQYTSGTTGFPKGCVLTHGYWLRIARTMQEYVKLGRDDVVLTAQPQSYMDPSWNLVLALHAGAPLVVLPRFSAATFWPDVVSHGATFFYCIGTMPLYLLRQPADPRVDRGHRVRLVYCSGIPAAMHEEFERRWGCPWRETYGTTELGVVLATRPNDETSVGSGSMGGPVPHREIRVVGDNGADVASGEQGELLVRGPDTMSCYHDDADATKEWCVDGWARTGDVVVDTPSGLTLVGRRKDMIRRAGENVSAAEVEAVLATHPAVRAAACIAVPDDLRGEEIKAYVQRTDGADVTPAEIHAWVAARLARFKTPRYIEFVDAFPLTQSDKIAKGKLIESRTDHASGSWDAEAE